VALLLGLVRAPGVAVAGQGDALSLRRSRTLFGFLDGDELAGPAIAASDPAVWFFGCHGYYSEEREGKKLPPDLALGLGGGGYEANASLRPDSRSSNRRPNAVCKISKQQTPVNDQPLQSVLVDRATPIPRGRLSSSKAQLGRRAV